VEAPKMIKFQTLDQHKIYWINLLMKVKKKGFIKENGKETECMVRVLVCGKAENCMLVPGPTISSME
jgi:hypothetical protein